MPVTIHKVAGNGELHQTFRLLPFLPLVAYWHNPTVTQRARMPTGAILKVGHPTQCREEGGEWVRGQREHMALDSGSIAS